MKKVLAAILCAALFTSMSGCSNSPDEASEQINSNVISDEQENEVNSNDKTDKNQLPSFDSFEKDMNRIIADVLEPIGLGDEVEEWSVKKLYTYDQSAESEYDQMFLCEYGPDSIIKVSGMIIDGRIVQIKTLVSPALKKEEYSSEQVEYLALILMMPVSLYKDDYDFESLLIMIYNKTQKSGELFFKTMGENPLNFDTPPEIKSWGRISYPKVTFSDEEVIEKTAELYRKAYNEIQKFLG